MAVHEDSDFWRGFIRLYRSMPEVWQIKSEVYRDRYKKDLAYTKLIDYLKTKDKGANKDTLKRKLNTLRGSYRRERKKVIDNANLDGPTEEKYVPTLWYYSELDFLNNEENNEDNEGSNFYENLNESSMSCSEPQPKRMKMIPETEPKEPKKPKETATTATVVVNSGFKNMNECSEIYGMAWAAQFRQLAPDQQIHAKRAMDEILYQGMLRNLPQNQSSCCHCLKPTISSLATPYYSNAFEERKFELTNIPVISDGDYENQLPTKLEIDD